MTEAKLTKAAWKAALSVPIVEEWASEAEPDDYTSIGEMPLYIREVECGKRLDKG